MNAVCEISLCLLRSVQYLPRARYSGKFVRNFTVSQDQQSRSRRSFIRKDVELVKNRGKNTIKRDKGNAR